MWWLPRGVVSLALLAAGALTLGAARERWWPACPWGGFDSAACLRRQDHLRDHLVPTAPWEPVGRAAELAGASLLALAVAALLVPFVIRPGGWSGWWRPVLVATAAVPAAALAVLGSATLRAGRTGSPTPDGSLALGLAWLVWALAWPAALMAVAVCAPGRRRRPVGVAVAALLGLATPLPVLLLLGPLAVGYTSHDTAPWSEAAAAPLLALAAAAVWAAPSGARPRPQRPRSASYPASEAARSWAWSTIGAG